MNGTGIFKNFSATFISATGLPGLIVSAVAQPTAHYVPGVEGIKGVENSVCKIFALDSDVPQQIIRADRENMVVYFDTSEGSTVTVTTEEYEP